MTTHAYSTTDATAKVTGRLEASNTTENETRQYPGSYGAAHGGGVAPYAGRARNQKMTGSSNLPALISLILFFSISAAQHSKAQTGEYLFTTTSKMPAKGDFWLNTIADFENHEGNEYRFNLEYGVSSRLMLGITGVIEHQSGRISYDASDIEMRFLILQTKFFNATVHAAYELPEPGTSGEGEIGLLLSRDWDRWNVSANLMLDKEFLPEQSTAEGTLKVATAYKLSKFTNFGVEYIDKSEENSKMLVPGFCQKLSARCNLKVGYAIGLNRTSASNQVRVLFSMKF